jgi:hypothetical protein
VLHVTNGGSAVAVLRAAGMGGEIVPWRDVLHEGPVREGLELEALSRDRAAFIAEAGWAEYEAVLEQFRQRDAALRGADEEDEVVLWFEHDLYDQLQLVQVLDALGEAKAPRVSMVCRSEYLGTMPPARAAGLFSNRENVEEKQFALAREAWAAFRSPDPMRIKTDEREGLPYLGAALRRFLEEYPWTTDGKSRLERRIGEVSNKSFQEIFREVREEPAFLGDTVLRWHLDRYKAGRWLPRWLGGVRVDEDSPWRWDPGAGKLVRLG